MTPLTNASQTLPGATSIPLFFLSNHSLDTLHNYMQNLLNSQQYVLEFVGNNPYPSGQGPFNLDLPDSQVYKHALARCSQRPSDRRVPAAQMSL